MSLKQYRLNRRRSGKGFGRKNTIFILRREDRGPCTNRETGEPSYMTIYHYRFRGREDMYATCVPRHWIEKAPPGAATLERMSLEELQLFEAFGGYRIRK